MQDVLFHTDSHCQRPPGGLFEAIATDIHDRGYSVRPSSLPDKLARALWQHRQSMSPDQFVRAGIGRECEHMLNQFVRTDEICWITGESPAGSQWLNWAAELQQYLNRHLMLGLFSFESHFAHYAPGDYYRRHLDAFKGEANRVLSLVTYLNPGWQPDDGGELVIYTGGREQHTLTVTPSFATVVVFLSEAFPHEVLAAKRDRYSIAGWYRVNGSTASKADPPV